MADTPCLFGMTNVRTATRVISLLEFVSFARDRIATGTRYDGTVSFLFSSGCSSFTRCCRSSNTPASGAPEWPRTKRRSRSTTKYSVSGFPVTEATTTTTTATRVRAPRTIGGLRVSANVPVANVRNVRRANSIELTPENERFVVDNVLPFSHQTF